MSLLDIIIIIVLALFVWKGIKLGLIEAIGGIIGLFIGVFMASRYYEQFAATIKPILLNSDILAKVVSWLLIFIIINRGVALIFWLVDKIFGIIAIIPFLKSINHLLGGIFGLLEGLIFIAIVILFLTMVPFTGTWQSKISQSRFSGIFNSVGKIIKPFIPESMSGWSVDLPALPNPFKGLQLTTPPKK
ncbi:MAG: CvpA family protein [Candidatus Komeilibacteria bacterium]|nr:CvpA family protein [Candidatus Komeilibacteria bacterium]